MSRIEYRICNLDGFRLIPPEKIDSCLEDFKLWLEKSKSVEDCYNSLSKDLGLGVVFSATKTFVWVDSDEGVDSIQIKIAPREEGGVE